MPMTAVRAMPRDKIELHLLQTVNPARKLAPAPQDRDLCKKKIDFNRLPYAGSGPQPASVARRNARERNRVKQVNNGFAVLRERIPTSIAAEVTGTGRGASKKLSKVDTLRLAVEYIRSLKDLLDDRDDATSSSAYDDRSYYADSPESSERPIDRTPPSSEASISPAPPSFPSEKAYAQNCASYENYEPMSPEDEELLDVIYWWQQQ